MRRGFRILYDENGKICSLFVEATLLYGFHFIAEVNVSVDDFVLIIDVQEVNVTILDDGQPVANDTIITLTLEQYGSAAKISDVVLKTATLIIRADEGKVIFRIHHSSIEVGEIALPQASCHFSSEGGAPSAIDVPCLYGTHNVCCHQRPSLLLYPVTGL